MAHKNYYKKLFIATAALFILFAPVGMTIKGVVKGSASVLVPTSAIQGIIENASPSPYSSFRLSFNVNLAEATTVTTGAGAGSTPGMNNNPLDCAKSLVTCGVYYVSLTVNGSMAVFVTIGAWLVRLGLQFNDNIYNSPAVQTGFSVALAIANLGFVLGIIVIAIATILRNQTYGIKQLLWKLVMMAILVNFGLVITAPIVGFANSMSNYFINATSPSAATGGYEGYVQTMTKAFSPQTPMLDNAAGGSDQATFCGSIWATITGFTPLCMIKNVVTGDDAFWQNTMALMFDIVFSAVTVFTFLCLAVLLIIRYLILAGLLIILPLAWLTYVFPKFDNSYSKWWNTFIKWTFFPPLALFFIYLSFITATQTSTNKSYLSSAIAVPSNAGTTGVESGVMKETGIGGNVIEQAADEVLLAGLMIMGLLFASTLAGKAGSTAVNLGTSASKAVTGYAGRKAKKGAARAYQGMRGGRLNTALQKSRIPFVSTIGRGAANLTEAGTKNQVDARHKAMGLGGMSNDRLKIVAQGLSAKEDQLAVLQEFHKRNMLDDKDVRVGGKNLGGSDGWLRANQGTLKNFDQGKLGKDVDTTLVSNETIRRAAEAKAAARPNAEATATMVDEKGIMGTAGATVNASDMVSHANEAIKNAQEVADRSGTNTFVPHNGSMARAGDVVKEAQTSLKGANDAIDKAEAGATVLHNGSSRKVENLTNDAQASLKGANDAIDKRMAEAPVADTENTMGRGAGQMVKAGELMEAAAEKFWEGKDKGDVSKMNMSAVFSGKAKFGMDAKTLSEIGKSVAHGIAMQAPGLAGTVAGKIDNWKQLTEFTNTYKRSIDEAERTNKMTSKRAQDLRNAIDKLLVSKLSFLGGPEPAAPVPAAAPIPPPTPRTP
jgi:hypothetical protein